MANISISQMNTRAEANLSDLHEVAYADGNSQTGYASGKMTMEVMANAIVNGFTYQSLGNKKISKAIEDAEVTVDTALDPTSTNAVQNKAIAHELAGGNTQASGDVVTISDGSNLALTSATSTLTPIQDLHGYSYPWVGGAGKNLLPMTVEGIKSTNTSGTWSGNVYTYNGVTFELLTDNGNNVTGIQVSGTCNNTFNFISGVFFNMYPNTTYYTSGCPSGGSGTTYEFNIGGAGSDYGNGGSFTYTGQSTVATTGRITIYNGATITTPVIFYPMIRTSGDSTFNPYSNICPISGYDSASYNRCGVNAWDEEWEKGTFDINGNEVSANDRIRSKKYILCTPNTTYYIKCPNYSYIFFYDVNKTFISSVTKAPNETFSTPTNARYIRFRLDPAYGTTYNHDISINYPSTITTYQLYQAQNVTLTFENTVYSGVIDWISGVVTVDKAMVDLGSLTWTYSNDNKYFYANMPSNSASPIAGGINAMCSDYIVHKGNTSTMPTYAIVINSTDFSSAKRTFISDARYTDASTFTTAMDGVQLLYELATPTTITLTPNQLKTLAGYNTIYTDVGNISIAYQPNNVIAECKEYTDNAIPTVDDALDDTSLNPIANKPVAEAIADIVGDISDIDSNIEGSKQLTTTGNVITVSDSAATYLEELEVEVEPVQDLHGYDYPWVGGAGYNIWDEEWELGNISTYNGENVPSSSNIRSKNYIPILPSTTYYYNNIQLRMPACYDVNKDFVGSASATRDGNVGWYLTIPQNAKYFRFDLSSDYGTTYNNDICINISNSNINGTYYPYSNICPITGYDDVSVQTTDEEETTTNTITATFDNTVYSGHVDFTNGVVTVDKGYIASYNGETLTGAWISDRDVYTSGGTPTTGAEVVYELATPQTIQLTPQQLQMLKGYNTVTTDANGGMTIKYQPDNVVGEIKAYASRLYDDILDRLEALSE